MKAYPGVKGVHQYLKEHEKTLSIAESCTGGSLAVSLVEIPEASRILLGSIVVYSNEWKRSFLNVREKTLESKGAASQEVAKEMVEGLFQKTQAEYAVSTTGVIGQAWIAIGRRGELIQAKEVTGPKERRAFFDFMVKKAFEMLWERLQR